MPARGRAGLVTLVIFLLSLHHVTSSHRRHTFLRPSIDEIVARYVSLFGHEAPPCEVVILAVRQNKPHSRCGGAQGDTRLRAVPYPAYVHVASAVAVTPLPRMCAPAVATAPHVHAAPALAKAPHVHGLPPSASSHPGPSQPRLSDLASVRVCHIYIQPSEFLLSAASDLIM